MASVSQFAQYLLKLDPQRNQARLTLYNFLRSAVEPSLPFSPAIIDSFYSRVLQFDHWQTDAQNLSDTVRGDVATFIKQTITDAEADAWAQLRHPDTLQLVQLKGFHDLEELVTTEHAPRQKSGDALKVLKISEQQILTLILSPAGGLEVKVYPNLALVWGAKLRPVAPVSHLFYGADNELMPNVRQTLDGSLLTTHYFHVDFEGVHGVVTRGYMFQKFETFIRAKLQDTQDLFSSLKKLERHFIDPQTDADYQDLVGKLERANRLLNNPHPDNVAAAERALNRGRVYLKTAFPNDRLLGLLVTHLEYGISQTRSSQRDLSSTQ